MNRQNIRAGQRACLQGAGARARRVFLGAVLLVSTVAQASFMNGDFEAGDLNGWTQEAWINNGTAATDTFTPRTLADLLRTAPAGTLPLNSVVSAPEATTKDILWVSGSSDLLLPVRGGNTARINLTDTQIPRSVSPNASFTQKPKTASAIAQEVTLTADDIDKDGKIHIRFIAAPVLDDPDSGHTAAQRPYYAIALVKTFDVQTNATVSKELFFKYHYAGQPGVAWKTFTDGNNHKELFTDPQAYDVAPGNEVLRVGDKVRLIAIAAGCSPGGHSGHLYVDNFTTALPKGVWITASGPVSAPKNDGTEITYTYSYTNNGSTAVNNVVVSPAMPQDSTGASTSFVSLVDPKNYCTAPAGGPGSTGPANCSIPILAPGETLTFQMTVKVPPGTPGDQVNNGNYTIGGDGVATLMGAMVQTQLLGASETSDMVPDATGLPPAAIVGVPYTGSFSCKNNGAASAGQATCNASGLPPGVVAGQCTLDGAAWMQPGTVPSNKEVVCQVSGTPTGSGGSSTVTVTTGGDNDLTPGNNTTTSTIAVTTTPDMQINLGGLPTTSPLNIPYSGSFTCSNQGLANAVSGTSCAVTGLPAGVTQGACSISPGNAAWVAGNAVPVGATVTCQVSGTPTAAGSSTVTGTTGATDDSNAANNTATMNVSTVAVPDMGVDLSGLPTAFTAGTLYSGSFVCKNQGSADASSGTLCTVTGLPPGVSQGACRISPSNAAWSAGDAVPAGASVTCTVSGTPSSVGAVTLTGSTGATGDANPANNTASRAVAGAVSPASIPTLSEWGLILMSGLMGIMGWGMVRRRRANPL